MMGPHADVTTVGPSSVGVKERSPAATSPRISATPAVKRTSGGSASRKSAIPEIVLGRRIFGRPHKRPQLGVPDPPAGGGVARPHEYRCLVLAERDDELRVEVATTAAERPGLEVGAPGELSPRGRRGPCPHQRRG